MPYINPPDMTKEAFLDKYGQEITDAQAAAFMDLHGETLPVCLVSNGSFKAAGIAYDKNERNRFIGGMGGRQHQWYLMPRSVLEPYLGTD